eukprot:c1928_g1_i1.p1 GENE.c1928_g1_i1~~c1928_g1_i1.p1  ORF type:complete len:289 (-),score=65.62 c1928_g1_i1:75-914(-)
MTGKKKTKENPSIVTEINLETTVPQYIDKINKFDGLRKILQDYTLRDILGVDEDTIIEDTPVNLRASMRLFLKNTVPFAKSLSSTVDSNNEGKGYLNLSEKVVSQELAKWQPEKISIASLPDQLKNTNFQRLDLSWCTLFDSDFVYILQICEQVPSIKILELQGNRFNRSDKKSSQVDDKKSSQVDDKKSSLVDNILIKILEMNNIKFLNISGNPIATVDHIDLFAKFEEKHFKKLIFIPEFSWIIAGNWKAMIKKHPKYSEQLEDIIIEAHKKYFQII